MFEFGKKVTYRPILISLLWAILPLISLGIAFNFYLGLGISFLIFAFVLTVYYSANLPTIFGFWQADESQIKYTDMTNYGNRLKMIFLPFKNQLTTINKRNIQTISVNGDLSSLKETATMIPYSGFYAVLTPVISMINNPVSLTLTLKNGQNVELNLSRDYTYKQKETIQKLDQFLNSFNDVQINNYNHNHKVSIS